MVLLLIVSVRIVGDAPAVVGRVAADGAVGHSQRRAAPMQSGNIGDTAAEIVADSAVTHRERADEVDRCHRRRCR